MNISLETISGFRAKRKACKVAWYGVVEREAESVTVSWMDIPSGVGPNLRALLAKLRPVVLRTLPNRDDYREYSHEDLLEDDSVAAGAISNITVTGFSYENETLIIEFSYSAPGGFIVNAKTAKILLSDNHYIPDAEWVSLLMGEIMEAVMVFADGGDRPIQTTINVEDGEEPSADLFEL